MRNGLMYAQENRVVEKNIVKKVCHIVVLQEELTKEHQKQQVNYLKNKLKIMCKKKEEIQKKMKRI